MKTIAKYKKTVWGNVSKYVRMKAASKICVSCGKPITGNVQAGHWIAKGTGVHEAVRFDERNIHPQCFFCNNMLDGNIVFYTEYLQTRYNEATLEDLKKCSKIKVRWTLEILEWINQRAKNNLKRLEKGLDTKMITWYTIDNACGKLKRGDYVEP